MTILSDGLQAAKATVDFFRISTLKSNAALGMQKAQVIGSAIAQRAAAVTTGVATAAQWAWNVAMTANPIGLVVAGVAALVAGGIWLYKTWEPFQLLVDKLWSGFKKLIEWSPIGLLFKAGSMIGSMFGDDKPAVEVGATQTPRSRSDQPAAAPSALPHVAPATRNSTINSNPKITINQAPGQSTDDMRDMVQQELRNHEQRLAVRKRGALHD
jgi:hypothetical protein